MHWIYLEGLLEKWVLWSFTILHLYIWIGWQHQRLLLEYTVFTPACWKAAPVVIWIVLQGDPHPRCLSLHCRQWCQVWPHSVFPPSEARPSEGTQSLPCPSPAPPFSLWLLEERDGHWNYQDLHYRHRACHSWLMEKWKSFIVDMILCFCKIVISRIFQKMLCKIQKMYFITFWRH